MNKIFFTQLSSKTINLLRLPLAILVVILHCNARLPELNGIDIFSKIYNLLKILFSGTLCHIAVPTFFLISGYLFFLTNNGGGYKSKLKKRFFSLLIPYLIWNAVYIVFNILIKYNLDYKQFFNDYGNIISLFYNCCTWGDVMQPMSGPFLYPLWFIRDLIILSLISPIIHILIKKLRIFYVIVLLIIYTLLLWPNISCLSINAIFFFSIGAYLSIEKKDIVSECKRLKNIGYLCFIILLVFITYMNIYNNSYPKNIFGIYLIASVVSMINLGAYITSKNIKIKKDFIDMSFFIYCVHHVFLIGLSIKIINKLISSFTLNVSIINLTLLLLTPIVVLIFCHAVYKLIGIISPIALKILNGNRI